VRIVERPSRAELSGISSGEQNTNIDAGWVPGNSTLDFVDSSRKRL
jgi:hypothetical protein